MNSSQFLSKFLKICKETISTLHIFCPWKINNYGEIERKFRIRKIEIQKRNPSSGKKHETLDRLPLAALKNSQEAAKRNKK